MTAELRAFLGKHRRFARLLDDPAVSEVRVGESGDVVVRGGDGSASGLGRSDARALFEAFGPEGGTRVVELGLHRWVRLSPPNVRPGPLVFATRVREKRQTGDELVAAGILEPGQLEVLSQGIAAGRGILVAGAPEAKVHLLLGALLETACEDRRAVVVLERRSVLDTMGLSPTCVRRAALAEPGGEALRQLAENADVVVLDDVTGDDWGLVLRRGEGCAPIFSVEVSDHQKAVLETVRRWLARTGADHVKLPSEAGVHLVVACVADDGQCKVRAVYELPDKPLTASTKYVSLKPLGHERKPLLPSKDTQELPPVLEEVELATEQPTGGAPGLAPIEVRSPLDSDVLEEPPTADEPPAKSLDPSPEVEAVKKMSASSSQRPAKESPASRSVRKLPPRRPAGAKSSSSRPARKPLATSGAMPSGSGASKPAASAKRKAPVAPSSPSRPVGVREGARKTEPLEPIAGPAVTPTPDVASTPEPPEPEVPASAPADGAPDPNTAPADEASLRLRRRLGRPPAGQAWARAESRPQSAEDLPDAATEEVSSVDRAASEEGRLRPMPRRNVVSRSAPRADASSAEPRRTPVEGMRVRRMMTTGVVDRLPRPRKTDEPEERRTGAVRRLSRRGGAIDRQASFKPPERADPSGLRDAGVEVHVGGAAASTTQTSSPGASDEVVTIQRPASELRGPASAAVTDDTAEMRVEDLMLPVVDEDEATRERKLPKGE